MALSKTAVAGMLYRLFIGFAVHVLFLAASPMPAQIPTGTPQFGTFSGGSIDTVNLSTLNTHIEIPLRTTPGRLLPFSALLTQDTASWYPAYSTLTRTWNWQNTQVSDPNWPGTQ